MSSKGMDNDNQKKIDEMLASSSFLENEELEHIKSQLDHSLELSKISVSEELIKRTLEAIKNAENETPTREKPSVVMKKMVSWLTYARRTAGAVAALLVLGAGITLLHQMGSGGLVNMKADKSSDIMDGPDIMEGSDNYSKGSSDRATSDSDKNSGYGDKGVKPGDKQNEVPEYDYLEESGGLGDSSSEKPTMAGTKDNGGMLGVAPEAALGDLYKFGDIFVSAPKEAEYIKITEVSSSKQLLLSKSNDIDKFYGLMEQYEYIEDKTPLSRESYIIEARSIKPEELNYTLTIGDHISSTKEGSKTINYSTENIKDMESLIQRIKKFYTYYN